MDSKKEKTDSLNECIYLFEQAVKEATDTKSKTACDSAEDISIDLMNLLIKFQIKDEAKILIDKIIILQNEINLNDPDHLNYYIIKNLFSLGYYGKAFDYLTEIENQFDTWIKQDLFKDFSDLSSISAALSNVNHLKRGTNHSLYLQSISNKFNHSFNLSGEDSLFLYNHSEHTQYLPNILFYQAKMACFFEKERNEEKLDMLSEVIDIKDWRRISASA